MGRLLQVFLLFGVVFMQASNKANALHFDMTIQYDYAAIGKSHHRQLDRFLSLQSQLKAGYVNKIEALV